MIFSRNFQKLFYSCNSFTWNTRWSNSGYNKIPSHNTKLYIRHSVNISAIYIWNCLKELCVNILFYQLPLNLRAWLKNTTLLIIPNYALVYFVFFIIKSFYYFNLIWFYDLFVQGNFPYFCPAIQELQSNF